MMAKKYYAIRVGKKTGVFYDEWNVVKTYVQGFPNVEYKGFSAKTDAENYLNEFKGQDFFDDEYVVHVYSDGSYFPNKPTKFSSGAVVVIDGEVIFEISKSYEHKSFAETRNIAGEVMAIFESLKYCRANEINRVLFFVDYQGLISWWNGSWQANSEVAKYFVRMIKSFSDIEINFRKVAAHTGNHFNEIADQLAKRGKDIGVIEEF
jgi:ribonuclease HI